MKQKLTLSVILFVAVIGLVLEFVPTNLLVKRFDINNEIINVKAGDIFFIDLQVNQTTGYVWQPKYDTDFLVLKEQEYRDAPGNKTGRVGTEIFLFEASHSGEGFLDFSHLRPWEQE